MTEVVILVPGIMGSILENSNHEVIWPGSPHQLIFPYTKMAELLNPQLTATDVIRNVSISDQYVDLINSLNTCGFVENDKTLKVFPYDWRKDNVLAVNELAKCIDELVDHFGDECEIDLVAHSMGGLICRYYLESDKYTNRTGFLKIKCLLTIGTPHRGSPVALAAALGQEKRLFLNAKQVQQVASDINFPSLNQLLPPIDEPFAWNRSSNARFSPLNIYDKAVATSLGLVNQNLNSASNFHAGLNLSRRPQHVRYFFFVGTRQTTTNSVQISSSSGKLSVIKIDRDDAGDGTVPIWSSLQSGIQTEPVGGEHGELYKNSGLKSTLATLLGKPGVLLARGQTAEISVLNKVVTPGDSTQVTIDFPRGTTNVAGLLELKWVVNRSGIVSPAAPVTNTYPITYSGPKVDHLAVLMDAPNNIGIYELSYYSNNVKEASTELFVQDI